MIRGGVGDESGGGGYAGGAGGAGGGWVAPRCRCPGLLRSIWTGHPAGLVVAGRPPRVRPAGALSHSVCFCYPDGPCLHDPCRGPVGLEELLPRGAGARSPPIRQGLRLRGSRRDADDVLLHHDPYGSQAAASATRGFDRSYFVT